MRFSWVGALNVSVTRCSLTRRSHAVGSNLRSTTMVPPTACANNANDSGPEWYSGPVVMCTGSGCSRSSRRASRPPRRRRCRCASHPSASRWCPTCRSSWRRRHRPRGRRRRRAASRAAAAQRARPTPRSPDGALAAEHEHVAHLRELVAHRGDRSGACSASTTRRWRRSCRSRTASRSALNRYDTGTDVSPTLRLAWSVAMTSSELGPHHAMRSPRARAEREQRVGEPVGEDLELGVRRRRRPGAPAASTITAALAPFAPACCVRRSMEGSVAYRHVPDRFRRATPRPRCRW